MLGVARAGSFAGAGSGKTRHVLASDWRPGDPLWSGSFDRFASVSFRTVPPSRQVRRSSRDSYCRSRPCLSVCRLLILTTCIAVGWSIMGAS